MGGTSSLNLTSLREAEPCLLADDDMLDSKELLLSVSVPLFCSEATDCTWGDADLWNDRCMTFVLELSKFFLSSTCPSDLEADNQRKETKSQLGQLLCYEIFVVVHLYDFLYFAGTKFCLYVRVFFPWLYWELIFWRFSGSHNQTDWYHNIISNVLIKQALFH